MKMPLGVKTLLPILLFPSFLAAADYRCADENISVSASSAELLAKCGEPDWKQTRTEEILVTVGKDTQRKSITTLEEWTYNIGPDRFMRIFRLRDGKVASMQIGGYGFSQEQTGRAPCSDQAILTGESIADVTVKCGPPAGKDKREVVIQERIDDNTSRKITLMNEDWTFNSGPDRFLRVITFRDGKVTGSRFGGYGYAEKSQ
jgi:hypothetical protein